jgi:hypothetical protein
MLKDIMDIANKYAEGLKHVQDRRAQWLEKHKELKVHLKEVADNLNTDADYKPGYFVDTLHAFNEDINGTCAEMPSISLRTGDMPMHVTFRNNTGERKELIEEGFHLTFTPTITGQVLVLLFPHYNELDKNPPPYLTLAVINEPAQLNMDLADQFVIKGMQAAFSTSFTGIADQRQEQEPPVAEPIHAHNQIGFKRYETTEKVK